MSPSTQVGLIVLKCGPFISKQWTFTLVRSNPQPPPPPFPLGTGLHFVCRNDLNSGCDAIFIFINTWSVLKIFKFYWLQCLSEQTLSSCSEKLRKLESNLTKTVAFHYEVVDGLLMTTMLKDTDSRVYSVLWCLLTYISHQHFCDLY